MPAQHFSLTLTDTKKAQWFGNEDITCNDSDHLRDTLESLARECNLPKTLIIADDGSYAVVHTKPQLDKKRILQPPIGVTRSMAYRLLRHQQEKEEAAKNVVQGATTEATERSSQAGVASDTAPRTPKAALQQRSQLADRVARELQATEAANDGWELIDGEDAKAAPEMAAMPKQKKGLLGWLWG